MSKECLCHIKNKIEKLLKVLNNHSHPDLQSLRKIKEAEKFELKRLINKYLFDNDKNSV